MVRRIFTLTRYLFRSLLFSLAGLIYLLLMLAFWRVFFDPTQITPEADYYVLVVGLFGLATSFLVTLSVATRANRASHTPLLVRLPSRVEYLTAVLLASLLFVGGLQLVLAILGLYRGPALTLGRIVEIPPIWISANVLAAALALHASDMVTKAWSRVYVYGVLAFFLFGQSMNTATAEWLSGRVQLMTRWLFQQGWQELGRNANILSTWLTDSGAETIRNTFSIPLWPFYAISDATIAGYFRPAQALGPAILLLYATLLFLLAADFFATKDLHLPE